MSYVVSALMLIILNYVMLITLCKAKIFGVITCNY